PQPFRARQGHPRPPRPGSAVASVVLASCLAGATAGPALAQTRAAPAPLPPVPVPHEVHARIPPLKAPKSALVEFDLPPFPYEGVVPLTQRPFLDVTDEEGRRGHSSARAGVLWEDATYSDKR